MFSRFSIQKLLFFFRNHIEIPVLLGLVLLIQGCCLLAGTAVVGLAGAAGFTTYKTVQLFTGGKVEIRYQESSISASDSASLQQIKTLAIWPSPDTYSVVEWWPSGNDAKLAEELEKTNKYHITTPNAVREAASKLGINVDLNKLTRKERIEAFDRIASHFGVDGILYHAMGSHGYDYKPLSWQRGEGTIAFSITVYSKRQKNIIWEQPGSFVIIGGRKTIFEKDETGEMQKILLSSVCEKLLDVSR